MSDVPTGGEPLDPSLDPAEPQALDPNDPGYEEPPEPEVDENGDPIEPEPEPEDEPQPQARRNRPGEGARWRQRYEEARREADELRARTQTPAQPQQYIDPMAQQRMEQEWFQSLAQTDPAAAYQALWGRAQQQMQQALFLQNAQTTDRIDKQAYDQLARSHKVYRDYQPAVERELAQARARMDYQTTREDIFHRLLGRDAADRAINAAPAQRRAAAVRVSGQRTQPTGGRSDGAGGNRRPQPGSAEHDEQLIADAIARGVNIFDLP